MELKVQGYMLTPGILDALVDQLCTIGCDAVAMFGG